MEKTLTERLCKDLEDPRNTDRWKALPGVTPDPEALLTKIEVRGKWRRIHVGRYEWTNLQPL